MKQWVKDILDGTKELHPGKLSVSVKAKRKRAAPGEMSEWKRSELRRERIDQITAERLREGSLPWDILNKPADKKWAAARRWVSKRNQSQDLSPVPAKPK